MAEEMGFVVSGARVSKVQRSATSFRTVPSRSNVQAKQIGALEKEVNTITSFLVRLTSEPGIGGSGGIRTHVPLEAVTAFRVRAVMTTSIRFLIF